MVITRTGISLHLAGTIGEWLGHVLNVITGRMDRPGGRRFERGYVDALKLSDMLAKPMSHKSRLPGRDMVAGTHALDELPDEITTPGRGQIRATGDQLRQPGGLRTRRSQTRQALEQLDLLVAIDFVQRESHRHAHWLLPAVHWLERNDLPAITSGMHDEPYVQYGHKAVEPPPGAREEWRIFVDLALAMSKPLFGAEGVNGFVKATRTARDADSAGPASSSVRIGSTRLMVAMAESSTAAGSNGATSWPIPHGWVLGPREFGHFKDALKTDDKMVHAAPPEFVERARELLAEPAPRSAGRLPVPVGEPAQPALDELVAQRAARPASRRVSATRWSSTPTMRPLGHQRRRPGAGVLRGRRDRTRRGDQRPAPSRRGHRRPRLGLADLRPARRQEPESYGANRNLLIDGAPVDPLSQQPAMSSSYVGSTRLELGPRRASRRPLHGVAKLAQPLVGVLVDEPDPPGQRVGPRPRHPGVDEGVKHPAFRLPQPSHHRYRHVGEEDSFGFSAADLDAPADLTAEAGFGFVGDSHAFGTSLLAEARNSARCPGVAFFVFWAFGPGSWPMTVISSRSTMTVWSPVNHPREADRRTNRPRRLRRVGRLAASRPGGRDVGHVDDVVA